MSAAPDGGATHGPARRRQRVLVVEDEWLIAMQIETILRTMDLEVVGPVGDAAAALALVDTAPPDLVLMDISLRGAIDGIEAVARIRARADIACLFVSASLDPATLRRAQLAAPVGWLSKPFSERELAIAVRAALPATDER